MKQYKSKNLMANKLSTLFKKNKVEFDNDVTLHVEDDAINILNKELTSSNFTYISMTHYEVNLFHEYLKHQGRGKGDYSKKVYLPEDYRVNSIIGTISKTSIDHIGHQYLKDFDNVTLVNFLEYKGEERMLLNSCDNKIKFIDLPQNYIEKSNILEYLEGKRVLVLSSFSELIKIQHLNQKHMYPNKKNIKGNFEILTINIDQVYRENDAYSLFEKLDALKVEILKYDFDVVLINLSVLNLPVSSFVSTLHRSSLALGNDLYKIFGIAEDSAEKSKHDNHWVDLNAYRKGNEDTFLATGVIGAPIRTKKPRRQKHVR